MGRGREIERWRGREIREMEGERERWRGERERWRGGKNSSGKRDREMGVGDRQEEEKESVLEFQLCCHKTEHVCHNSEGE